MAFHLLGPSRAMTVQPRAVTLQLVPRGGDDAARHPEGPVGAGDLDLDLVGQTRHGLGSHSCKQVRGKRNPCAPVGESEPQAFKKD